MLDTFEILSTSGVVLWSKTYTRISPSIVNGLIRDVFIEEQGKEAGKQSYQREGKTLRWTVSKDLGLIFVAVYQSILHLQWIDELLSNVRKIFTELYGNKLQKGHTNFRVEHKFDSMFDRQVEELSQFQGAVEDDPSSTSGGLTPPSTSSGNEKEDDEEVEEPPPPMPGMVLRKPQRPLEESVGSMASSTNLTPTMTPSSSRPATPQSHLLTSTAGPRGSRRARKAAGRSPAPASSGDETSQSRRTKKVAPKKGKRVWDSTGAALDSDDEDQVLDYSAVAGAEQTESRSSAAVEAVDESSWGRRTQKGEFVLKDLDHEINNILASANAKQPAAAAAAPTGLVGSATGAISSLFSNIVGGKTLTQADLEKPLRGMEEHLLKKNVAREAAVKLCQSVEEALVGTKTNSFTSIEATIQSAMSAALTKILTPTSSLDLLREIRSVTTGSSARPYVLSIVGVNGVGKSTNLSKLAYFLLQNKYRVLICAADTFRSGAVEQLKRHVDNLKHLTDREGGKVDIFEKGYGKDPGAIAADAVRSAAAGGGDGDDDNGYDIVLIDTAGRRHNDKGLMSNLSPFAQKARPDKILMVAEALAGTDSVAQARNFNAAFHPRKVDGFIVSKCDTVGSMVGTLVSMVSATGVPVVFLGTGQHYGDLRNLSVGWAVGLLME